MILLQKQRATELRDAFRVFWADSSPLAGYDWEWSQYHEVRTSDAIKVFDAVTSLHYAIKEFVDNFEDELLDGEKDLLRHKIPMEPQPEWKPLHDILEGAIYEHIHTPAALGSGNRSLADKASAEAFKMALSTPDTIPLLSEADMFEVATGDMGTELGLPAFVLERTHEALLPDWFDRRADLPDVDLPVAPPDDEVDGVMLSGSEDDAVGNDPEPDNHNFFRTASLSQASSTS